MLTIIGDNDGLKSRIDGELPGLRESVRELQGKVDRKRTKKQQLKSQYCFKFTCI